MIEPTVNVSLNADELGVLIRHYCWRNCPTTKSAVGFDILKHTPETCKWAAASSQLEEVTTKDTNK